MGVRSGWWESQVQGGRPKTRGRWQLKGRPILCSLEQAPLVLDGELLVTQEGLERIVGLANRKFQLNVDKTKRFEKVGFG